MSKYELKQIPFSSHTKIINLVERGKTVLDVGCSKGFLAEELKKKGCTITGVDNNREDLREAGKYYDRTFLLDIENDAIKGKYDIIILGDILEHLSEPEKVLKNIIKSLNKEGYIILSVPNIANIYARLKLLFGNFDYEEKGIFDKTHLRFFTIKSFNKLIREAGYSVIKFDSTPIPIYLSFPNVSKSLLKPFYYLLNILNKLYPRMFAYQLIAKVK